MVHKGISIDEEYKDGLSFMMYLIIEAHPWKYAVIKYRLRNPDSIRN